jgi:hypothetical protein
MDNLSICVKRSVENFINQGNSEFWLIPLYEKVLKELNLEEADDKLLDDTSNILFEVLDDLGFNSTYMIYDEWCFLNKITG